MKISKLNGRGEIFYSIQGEGRNIGVPSVFIRSSLCNLYCVWCDTDYTWNWRGTPFKHVNDTEQGYRKYEKEEQIIELTPKEIASEVARYDCRNVVLTGGEPLLQQAGWIEVMDALRRSDGSYFFEVETNGTILPAGEFDRRINQYNVSPKLANSGVPLNSRERPDALRFFADSDKADFKFVVTAESDSEELLGLIQRYGIQARKVFLMPEGASFAALSGRQESVVEMCLKYGFRYSDRLHIRLFGEKRGT